MGCRKNIYSLTSAELSNFINALKQLKANGTYDTFIYRHNLAMMDFTLMSPEPCPGTQRNAAHRGPAFGPWHRWYILDFEKALQAIDPTVTLPYWDWAVDAALADPKSALLWTDAYIGGDGAGPNNVVPNGPFTDWVAQIQVGMSATLTPRSFPGLVRMLGRDPQGSPTLPTAQDVNDCMAVTPYDTSPWCESSATSPSFRNQLEGWILGPHASPGPGLHNRVHTWVGGDMQPGTSPNDPVFFLHHCNIDRLWAQWQLADPSHGYVPASGGPPGHNLMDAMRDLGDSGITPAMTLDHHSLGYWYDTEPAQVTLVTPSLAFTDIPAGAGATGVTTYRSIKFDVMSCADVTLQITAGPTAGFSAPTASAVVPVNAPPLAGLAPNQGRLWISYTSTTSGAAIAGTVTVEAVDGATGMVFGPWVVNLSANTVSRPTSAIVLVLDRSGSMALDAGNGAQRVDLLRSAVATFIDVMQQGDGLGIVRFDNLVDTIMSVTDVGTMPGGAGRTQAQTIMTSHDPASTLDPRGSTSIGGGIQAAKTALDAAPSSYAIRAMIVLTDGLENTPPMIADVTSSLTANTFAIGFGQAASISTAALNAITQGHGGYLVVTGPITPDETFALSEYFLKIQAGATNSSAVLDPRGVLTVGATHKIPFTLTSADMAVDVVLLSPAPYLVDFELQSPDDTLITPASVAVEPAIQFISTSRVSYYRASLPMLVNDIPGSHAGKWTAILRLNERGTRTNEIFLERRGANLPYSLLAHVQSNLHFKATILQKSFEPGASVRVSATLDQYDVPLVGQTTVWAEIAAPNGTVTTLALAQSAGSFSAEFTANDVGVYTVRVRCKGSTFEGQPFTREQRLTAVTLPNGDAPSPRPAEDPLCRLAECLLRRGAINPELVRSLEAHGLNLDALLKCIIERCKVNRESSLGGEVPLKGSAHIKGH